jgi:hypothetical protein
MRSWLLAHERRSVWSELERDPENPVRAQVRVHFAASGAVRSLILASCDYHPESIELRDDAVRELRASGSAPEP